MQRARQPAACSELKTLPKLRRFVPGILIVSKKTKKKEKKKKRISPFHTLSLLSSSSFFSSPPSLRLFSPTPLFAPSLPSVQLTELQNNEFLILHPWWATVRCCNPGILWYGFCRNQPPNPPLQPALLFFFQVSLKGHFLIKSNKRRKFLKITFALLKKAVERPRLSELPLQVKKNLTASRISEMLQDQTLRAQTSPTWLSSF